MLYMREENGHQHESSIFVGQVLQQGELNLYPNLNKTHPHLATVEAGDILYIPHKFLHEIYTQGDSIGVSAWLRPAARRRDPRRDKTGREQASRRSSSRRKGPRRPRLETQGGADKVRVDGGGGGK
jgi:hypothetical protein